MSMDETIISSIDEIEQESEKEPYLMILAGSDIGKLYPLKLQELVAGRSTDCDIWIEDNTISRKHFRIKKVNNVYTIQDLKSTNGTFVNGKRVKSIELQEGDKIQISKDTIMQFDYYDENRKISEEKRYEMGVIDPVTNTYNRSFFLQRISDEFSFSHRQNLPLSIVMIDLDFFKNINDTHGHLAGDKVLRDVSDMIKNMIRSDDVFCRYGGEEFVIIMRNTPCQAAVNLAERIRRKIDGFSINYEESEIHVTISCGVANLMNSNFNDYVSLLAEADKYLYQAKGEGRNRVQASCSPNV